MNTNTTPSAAWEQCPQGELRRLAGRLQRQDFHRTTRRAALAASVLAVTALGAYSFLSPRHRGLYVGGLWCDEAIALLADYRQRRLAPRALAQLVHHLDACPHCHKLRGQINAPSAAAGSASV